MQFGMLHLFESPIGKTEHQIVKEQLDLMVAAEEMGFDRVWPAEHHFTEYGYCASPAVTIAAVAQVTKRVRLGSGVVVLPLNHPIRIAEDYALLDLMSDGRVDLGLGRGYQPLEFRRYGVEMSTTRQRFEEGLQIIQQAWMNGRVDFHGKYYDFTDVPIRPQPLQKPHPPIWMPALSTGTFELAGRYGLNLMLGAVFGLTPELAVERREDYYRGLAAAGHSAADKQLGCLMMVYVADTMEQARREFRDAVEWYFRTVAKYVAEEGAKPVESYEVYSKFQEDVKNVDFDQLTEGGSALVGSPDYVIEQITKAQDSYGMTELMCWTRLGGLDKDKVLRSMQLMCDKVIPHTRHLAPPPPPQFAPEELTAAAS